MRNTLILFFFLLNSKLSAQKCISGDCQNGIGKAIYQDSMVYEGSFRSGTANGKGKLTFKTGEVVEGDFENGAANGKCTFRYNNGRVYIGDVKGGAFEGQGVFTSTSGERYEGTFRKNTFHGFGKYTYNDGSTYEGDFVNGKRQGKGKFLDKLGDSYEGDYFNDMPHGRGKHNYAYGGYYEGGYLNGKRNGRGREVRSYGEVFDGEYSDGLANGSGMITFRSGTVMQGVWKNGIPESPVKITFPDKSYYEGEYKDSRPFGHGKFYRYGKLLQEGFFGSHAFLKTDSIWLLQNGTFIKRLTFANTSGRSDFYEHYLSDGKIFFGEVIPLIERASRMDNIAPKKGIIIFTDGTVIGASWNSKPRPFGGWDTAKTGYKFYAVKSKLTEVDMLYYRGIAMYNTAWPRLATKYFSQAISRKYSNDSVYYYRSIAYRDIPEYSLGIADMNTFMKRPVANNIPYKQLVIMYSSNKDTVGALQVCDKWIKRMPDDSSAYMQQGHLLFSQKKFGESIASISKGISIQKGDKSWGYWYLAKCYEALAKFAEACTYYKLVTNTFYIDESRKKIKVLNCQ